MIRDIYEIKIITSPSQNTYYNNQGLTTDPFKALEISWRASKDIEVVKGIAPDNPDAKEVVRLFSEWKGIEE